MVDLPRSPRLAGAVEERLRDRAEEHLRRAWAASRTDPVPLRLLVDPLVDALVDRAGAELARWAEADPEPTPAFRRQLLAQPDPAERRSILARWRAHAERALDPLSAWREEADRVAESTGAGRRHGLYARTEAVDPRETLAWVEGGVLAPVDERLQRRLAEGPAVEAADVPRVEAMTEEADGFPLSRLPVVLRRLGGGLGLDPDGRFVVAVGEIDVGPLGGPVALRRGLTSFGRRLQAAVLTALRGEAASFVVDPALASGAGWLFGGLWREPAFVEAIGLELDEASADTLALEEAIALRRRWARLVLALEAEVDRRRIGEVVGRAPGRPATPEWDWVAASGRVEAASELRGAWLAAVLEERLRTRFGRRWYADRGAGRWLVEIWEAGPDASPEEMASALGLGRMDATPVAERFGLRA